MSVLLCLRRRCRPLLLDTAAVVSQILALFAEMLRMFLALVGNVETVRLFKGPLLKNKTTNDTILTSFYRPQGLLSMKNSLCSSCRIEICGLFSVLLFTQIRLLYLPPLRFQEREKGAPCSIWYFLARHHFLVISIRVETFMYHKGKNCFLVWIYRRHHRSIKYMLHV